MKDRFQTIISLAIIIFIVILAFAFIIGGFFPPPESSVNTSVAGVPNPAADYCTKMNNRYEIRNNSDGSQYGVCILPDGTVCDEWQYYRGACPAGIAPAAASVDVIENFCLSNNNEYQTRTDPNGNQIAICIFPGGGECDARDYYAGTCNETSVQTP